LLSVLWLAEVPGGGGAVADPRCGRAAVGIPLHLEAALLVLLAVNLAIVIPAAPGNLGSLELGAAFALTTVPATTTTTTSTTSASTTRPPTTSSTTTSTTAIPGAVLGRSVGARASARVCRAGEEPSVS